MNWYRITVVREGTDLTFDYLEMAVDASHALRKAEHSGSYRIISVIKIS